ncbi:MAG TPA: T9SS type A sorting domain-containing protein [Tenuifilaceae bacterium]|nr:T9SS type A sorting domain-containing protein [Tenuifilaceae bacterium]HPE17045.1 T9SS type A sorting domain-containing protein [Tenuifilaceae bacterium]HPJ44670.1 T9SS type A sorting domain-containing protein [Tenuifilaceae bacterium]HPQ32934.1 T9SS type A sorting domain-containing protein [Tenuifilaceae bacterium]HRX66752.1 T9SS type A sorting domain-containing protein [Tenuifilaceae bacterium]
MNYLFKTTTLIFTCFLALGKTSYATDTLRVMHYNLLYYDKNTSFCTSSNNNVDEKDESLKEIIGHFKPDIFTANEINGSPSSVQRILDNTLNVNGIEHYKKGNYQGEYLVNMLYYNSQKLVLKSQSYVLTSPRITDVYNLYLKTENLINGDTIFLTCFVGHLKAGNTDEDASERTTAAQQIMTYIQNRNIKGNVLVMGDFNLYTNTEGAFQKLTTPTSSGFRFFDPVNAIGEWNNNSTFSMFHTQSTHKNGDCFSTGGMDDRFDFILTSLDILQSGNLRYVENSYWAYGQDGKRFNESLVSSSNPNTSLPENILYSLYNMSDHLPVTLKLTYNLQTSINESYNHFNKLYVNGFANKNIEVFYNGNTPIIANFSVYNIIGVKVFQKEIELTPGVKSSVPIEFLNSGIYLVSIKTPQLKVTSKVVKN